MELSTRINQGIYSIKVYKLCLQKNFLANKLFVSIYYKGTKEIKCLLAEVISCDKLFSVHSHSGMKKLCV